MPIAPVVLVVDDEEAFAQTLSKRLELRGFKSRSVTSGPEALALLDTEPVDLIILDVLMPEMSGPEALLKIKEKYPLIPVLMLTGEATVERAIDGMKAGALDFLMKPCDIGVITEKLQQAYRRKCEHEERIKDAEISHLINRKGW